MNSYKNLYHFLFSFNKPGFGAVIISFQTGPIKPWDRSPLYWMAPD